MDAERQDPRGSFGSSPFLGATCRPPPPLRSSRLVRTDFSSVLIYMRATHTDSCPPKSPCAVEAMIVFGPSLPRNRAFFLPATVLARDGCFLASCRFCPK